MMEPVDFRGYCFDCENETIARDGRCGCGSGRVVRLSDAEARIKELERERDRWMGVVGQIANSVPIKNTIGVMGSVRDLIAYFDKQRASAEAAEARVAELEAKLTEADDLIEAQQHDFAQNNIRNAENAHRAEAAEANKEWLLHAIKLHSGSDHGLLGIRLLVERAEAAEALLKEAKTALEPFAKYAQDDCFKGSTKWELVECDRPGGAWFGAEDFRAARAIHDKIGGRDAE